jgi:hypothetical protein
VPEHPTREEREWLLDELRAVVRMMGHARFVSGLLVETNEEFFPDPFPDTATGVENVARRLLTWSSVDVPLRIDDERETADEKSAWQFTARDEDGQIRLTVTARGEPHDLPGALAHALALPVHRRQRSLSERGYRDGPAHEEPAVEAELAVLTTLALGWGIPLINAAERDIAVAGERIGGKLPGVVERREKHGALPLPALAYLLALQLVVRGSDDAEVERVLEMLKANQRKLVRSWHRELEPERAALRDRLGLPPVAEWPPFTPFVAPAPFPEKKRTKKKKKREARTERRPVFRVRQTRSAAWAAGGAVLGTLSVILMSLVHVGGPLAYGAVVMLCTVLGAALGRELFQYDVCSEPDCRDAVIAARAERCPSCRRRVAGRIKRASQRLAAEEALPPDWWTADAPPPRARVEEEELEVEAERQRCARDGERQV